MPCPYAPSGYLLFCNWVVTDTSNASLGTAGTARKLLIATILAQSAAVAGAHIAKVTALTGSLAGGGVAAASSGGSVERIARQLVAGTAVAVASAVARRSRVQRVLTLALGALLVLGR